MFLTELNSDFFFKDGSFLIAVANGTAETTSSTMIHCYRVTIKKKADNLSINSHTLPSFFLASGAGRDIPGKISISYHTIL